MRVTIRLTARVDPTRARALRRLLFSASADPKAGSSGERSQVDASQGVLREEAAR